MSVILDSLKKLDREKSYRGTETSNVAAKILESDSDRPVKRLQLYFLVIAFTVTATFTATYIVMARFGYLSGSPDSKPANPPKTEDTLIVKPLVETITSLEARSSVESKPLKASRNKKDEKKTFMPEKIEVDARSMRKTVEPSSNVSQAAPPPSLILSAIVWYEDSSMRFAMINGMKAIEGSEIEGGKVVKIKPTSVGFLHDGRYYEISMTK